jgi:hypothetical protein
MTIAAISLGLANVGCIRLKMVLLAIEGFIGFRAVDKSGG